MMGGRGKGLSSRDNPNPPETVALPPWIASADVIAQSAARNPASVPMMRMTAPQQSRAHFMRRLGTRQGSIV
jgi:hypothetical protein